MSATFDHTGQTLATTSGDKTIRLWNAGSSFEVTRVLQGHSRYVNCAAFSPDGKYVASGSNDKSIRIWQIRHDDEGQAGLCRRPKKVR